MRIWKHILFWSAFVALFVFSKMLFAAPTDLAFAMPERILRFVLAELVYLPWKIVPFYFLFYFLIPKYAKNQKYFSIIIFFTLVLVACLFGMRSMIEPLSQYLYGEGPDFNVYSFRRLLFSFTDMIPAFALASAIKLYSDFSSAQKRESELIDQKRNLELKYLKAQANPHFLFNTMNNLYGLARKNDPLTAPSILKLSEILRFILHESANDRIPLSNEIEIIEKYIELEKLRYGDRLLVDFKNKIDTHGHMIAPLILMPFVENAFKHGASESRDKTTIEINISTKEKEILFEISNNHRQHDYYKEGLGYTNIRRQLELNYPNEHSLTIENKDNIFRVRLLIIKEQLISSN